MQTRQFARQVQPEPITRNILAHRGPMKALEDMSACAHRNHRTRVGNRHVHERSVNPGRYTDPATGTVILPRVLQEILQYDRGIALLAHDLKVSRKISLHLDVYIIRQCAQIIQRCFDQLGKINPRKLELQSACVHPGQQQEILNQRREAERLMNQSGNVMTLLRRQPFVREQFFKARAQHGNGRFQLMGRVSREACGALQLCARHLQRGLRFLALRAVLLGVHRQLLHGRR